MAHVHGAAKAAVQHAAEAGAATAAPTISFHNVPQAAAPAISFHNVPKTAATATAASFAGKLLRNPWVLFGLGIAVGYMVHKHRKDIIGAANLVAEKGKDFVLQQKENLEDIVAESGESTD
jgi:hypothetical protein